MSRTHFVSLAVVAALGCKFKQAEEEQGSQPAQQSYGAGQNQLPPNVPVRGSDSAHSFNVDSKVAADAIATQMDEAVASSSASEDPSAAGGLGLGAGDLTWTNDKSCTEDPATGGAAETVKRTFNMDRAFGFFGRNTQVKASASDEIVRNWKNEGEPIKCANSRTYKRPSNMKGTVMDSTFTRSMSRVISSAGQQPKPGTPQNPPVGGPGAGGGLQGILGSLLGDIFKESKSSESKGKRKITWTADDAAGDVRTEKQTVETDSNKKITRSTDKGEISYETSVKTKDGDPIMLEVVQGKTRFFSMPIPESKIINSGTLISVRKDGSRIESHYDKVKYDFKKMGCFPVSGKITGEIYGGSGGSTVPPPPPGTPADPSTKGGDPSQQGLPGVPPGGPGIPPIPGKPMPASVPPGGMLSFVIDFASQTPVIEFSDGKKEPFIPMGCDFEDLSGAIH